MMSPTTFHWSLEYTGQTALSESENRTTNATLQIPAFSSCTTLVEQAYIQMQISTVNIAVTHLSPIGPRP